MELSRPETDVRGTIILRINSDTPIHELTGDEAFIPELIRAHWRNRKHYQHAAAEAFLFLPEFAVKAYVPHVLARAFAMNVPLEYIETSVVPSAHLMRGWAERFGEPESHLDELRLIRGKMTAVEGTLTLRINGEPLFAHFAGDEPFIPELLRAHERKGENKNAAAEAFAFLAEMAVKTYHPHKVPSVHLARVWEQHFGPPKE